jgi:hypothetical protein
MTFHRLPWTRRAILTIRYGGLSFWLVELLVAVLAVGALLTR